MKHTFIVYLLTNKLTGMRYIGKTEMTFWNKGYPIGCTSHFKKTYADEVAAFGIEAFKRQILKTFDVEQEALDYEKYLTQLVDAPNNPEYYNTSYGGSTRPTTVPVINKIPFAKKPLEVKLKISEATGETTYKEHKIKQPASAKPKLKTWAIIDTFDNTWVMVNDLDEYCKKMGFNRFTLYNSYYKKCLFKRRYRLQHVTKDNVKDFK